MAGRQPSALIRFVRRIAVAEAPATADGQLLRRFIDSRDADAFTALVERHGPMVFGVCRRMLGDVHEAEDCFQATFLILARRARAIGRPDLVGGWLHGVACRVAARARHVLARRRAQERQVVDVPAREHTPEVIWTDLRPVLDEEIDRLPQRYRLPFVLCYLDGRTNEEAAQLLGCPKGTILSRLATAREKLRRRLTRRGITLPAALLATLLAEHGTAAVPAALVEATTAGIAGTVAPHVIILVEGVLMTMRIHRLATMLGVMLAAVLLLGGAGALLRSPLLAQDEGDKQQPPTRQIDGKEKRPPADKADGVAQAVQPQSVIEAYEDNDARADELFNNKRVRVTGTMIRVKRYTGEEKNAATVYRLTLGQEGWPVPGMGIAGGMPGGMGGPGMPGFQRGGQPQFGPMGPPGGSSSGKGIPMGPGSMPSGALDSYFTFDFPLTAAKELAPLRPGQRITVEGRCEGPLPEHGTGTQVIRFRDAKLIEIHPEAGKTEEKKK